jgi:hypothetical protein
MTACNFCTTLEAAWSLVITILVMSRFPMFIFDSQRFPRTLMSLQIKDLKKTEGLYP